MDARLRKPLLRVAATEVGVFVAILGLGLVAEIVLRFTVRR